MAQHTNMSSEIDTIKDDDVVRAYLRQVGNLMRLDHEEEYFHINEFYQAREELKQSLCFFPKLFQERIEVCKTSEILENQSEFEKELNLFENKRERIVLLIQTIQRASEKLLLVSDSIAESSNEDIFTSLRRSMEKLLFGIQFSWPFYQDCVSKLDSISQAITSPKNHSSTDTSDIGISDKVLDYCPMSVVRLGKILTQITDHFRRMDHSRKTLVEGNLRLVISVAKKYVYHGVPFLDLIQEGNLGILQAVDRFQPDKGHRFSTYAVWWIRQAMITALAKNSRTIRIPANIASQISQIRKAEETLIQKYGQDPEANEVARIVDISVERVRALKKMEQQTVSLQSVANNEVEVSELIVDSEAKSPADAASLILLSETIDSVLDSLKEREKNVIIHRYGLMNKSKMTLEELGARFNVTQERIRQIEVMALKKLQHPSRRKFFDDYL